MLRSGQGLITAQTHCYLEHVQSQIAIQVRVLCAFIFLETMLDITCEVEIFFILYFKDDLYQFFNFSNSFELKQRLAIGW
jgi:hypothetical protein